VSEWLFTPTEAADANLIREGVPQARIARVGDVMFDVAIEYGKRVGARGGALERLGLEQTRYVLVTVHRAENTDVEQRLSVIVDALARISRELPVVWPLHPRTRTILDRIGAIPRLGHRVALTDPVGYLDMVQLEKHATVIATDSGGVQKEAFFHRVPCVTLRDETEWIELVEGRWNRLAPPTDAAAIVEAVFSAVSSMGATIAPYGDGNAASAIAGTLARALS
jgi:UDP-GlcNAc3NAcA epimerase